jgi:NTE family protein
MRTFLLSALLAVAVLSGCSTVRPWQNQPAAAPYVPIADAPGTRPDNIEQRPVIVALTLSGGGARAAAFGLGVLREMKATSFEIGGKQTTLLDQLGLISGVSGGSILAAHYAAFGDGTLTQFEPDFLLQNFDGDLISEILSPANFRRMWSPWYGRTNVLEERLSKLYHGLTFGDLTARKSGPALLVTATDLTTGSPFEFTYEQFALICSDLDSVPLSFAVASSSAVPIVLSPMTLANHAGSCPNTLSAAANGNASSDANYRVRMLKSSAESYIDVRERPYLHLVDGGLSDNLGLRGLIDRVVARGSIQDSFRGLPANSIHQVILISVNSERDLAERIDQSDRIPSGPQVMESLLFGAGARVTHVTLEMLDDDLRRWNEELNRHRGTPDSPFAADAEIHVVSLSLHDIPDPERRREALHVPTAFSISSTDVHMLQEAARDAMRNSRAFQDLRSSLKASPIPTAVAGGG